MKIDSHSNKLSENKINELTLLLRDCVIEGASVGYTDAIAQFEDMKNYWNSVNQLLALNNFKLVTIEIDDKIVGVVGLDICAKPNGRHRGEICKLLVSPRVRRQGLAKKLMLKIEDIAWELGLMLLTLDTTTKGITVNLYQSLGWTIAGEIPLFARSVAGDLEETTVMFKINKQ